jgi:O-antigen ligase
MPAARVLAGVDRAAFVACLAMPLALLHARPVAEVLIAAIDVLFVGRCVWLREAGWRRGPFSVAAGLWWVWLVICSALGTGGLLLGVLTIRLPLLSVALGEWVLAGAEHDRRRRWVWVALALSAGWIVLGSWQQYLTGHNLYGQGRWMDGALTGPFNKPRAGPELILLFFPVLLPAVAALSARRGRWGAVAAGGLVLLGALTMLLIGQRMPSLLMLFGFGLCALLIRRLRVAAGLAVLGVLALLAALPWVSPPSYAKLVDQTAPQIAHFAQSPYGLVFVRAFGVWELRPWLGQGFDGFRRGCSNVRAMHGIDFLHIPTVNFNGGMDACNVHPHNYYLEAWDNAGWPGLGLFTAMVAAALWQLGRGLGREGSALRGGVFIGALLAFWPIASTSAFTSLPNAGWVFVILGLGFAAGERRPSRIV